MDGLRPTTTVYGMVSAGSPRCLGKSTTATTPVLPSHYLLRVLTSSRSFALDSTTEVATSAVMLSSCVLSKEVSSCLFSFYLDVPLVSSI